MKTFWIQYRGKDGVFVNYTAHDDDSTIEFAFLNHAQSIAGDLAINMPSSATAWRIKDSFGNVYPIVIHKSSSGSFSDYLGS